MHIPIFFGWDCNCLYFGLIRFTASGRLSRLAIGIQNHRNGTAVASSGCTRNMPNILGTLFQEVGLICAESSDCTLRCNFHCTHCLYLYALPNPNVLEGKANSSTHNLKQVHPTNSFCHCTKREGNLPTKACVNIFTASAKNETLECLINSVMVCLSVTPQLLQSGF